MECSCVVGPRLIDGRVGVEFFGVGGSRSARTLHYFALLFLVFFLGGGCFGGGGPGGLITFLAGRLTRYSLGLAATLSTLLLHCTLSHAINFFFNLQDTLDFCIVVSCFFLGGFWGGS